MLAFALLFTLSSTGNSQIRQMSIELNATTLLNQYVSVPNKTGLEGNSQYTIAGSVAPYVDGVQPSDPLSALNGGSTLGLWSIEVGTSTGGETCTFWSVGLSFNNKEVVAAGPGTDLGIHQLRLVGSHPVSEGTAFEIELANDAEVELSLYDLRGRKVGTLFEGHQSAGVYRAPCRWRRRRPTKSGCDPLNAGMVPGRELRRYTRWAIRRPDH